MMPLLLSLALLAETAAPSASADAERATWHMCLEDYGQVAMASTSTAATIALQGKDACVAERAAFQVALWRSRIVIGDAAALSARFAEEDRAAYAHLIAFVERLR